MHWTPTHTKFIFEYGIVPGMCIHIEYTWTLSTSMCTSTLSMCTSVHIEYVYSYYI
jgi:hypothetical protein